MSIDLEIQRLQTAKADIKTAIEEKGVQVGDGLIDTYAEKISEKAAELSRLEVKAGDIYSLALQRPVGGKTEYTNKLFKTF